MAPDELDGPLFRVRTVVIAQIFDRSTKEWKDAYVLPEQVYTVVKRGDSIDLMAAQPALDLNSLPRRTIRELLKEDT